MSGIEFAGVVLAAFPLLISALEHYREGFEVLEDWWRIRKEYKKCKQNLNIQMVFFQANLEELLRPLVRDEDELSLLLAEPGGDRWLDRELEQGCKERLPKSYEIYSDIITEVNDITEKLKDELGVNNDYFHTKLTCGEANPVDRQTSSSARSKLTIKPKMDYQFQRIRFTVNKKRRNKLLDELAQYNNKLQQLLASSDRLVGPGRFSRQKPPGLRNSTLLRVWHYAKSLHALLQQTWRCKCKSLHCASLFLRHSASPRIEFKIQFDFSRSAEPQGPAPWTSQETTISLAETLSQPVPTSPAVSSDPNITADAPSIPVPKMKKKKGVTCLVLDPNALSHFVQGVGPTEISDLCTAIARKKTNCSCIGFLKDSEHRYNVYPAAEYQAKDVSSDSVTLASLLNKSSDIVLTRKQRYSIALIIASSYLQLHASPWLESRWSKNDIFFRRSGNNSILLDQPHIVHELCRASAPALQSSHEINDRCITTLGIMLLELCFGIALEDHHIRQKYLTRDGRPDPVLDLAAAMRWCDESANEEAGQEFADAIDWCLRNPTKARASADGREAGWREEMYAKVVQPLQYCHDQMTASARLA
ncbi:hypothetical protein MMC07_003062 [Pseudocyphellaria aurata]|nr:hypothetical protein [Pseudocyphellaria aurata]